MSLLSTTTKKFPAFALLAILAVGLLMRVNALWLPHWRGDQGQYVILATKLKHSGLDGYNLRAVDLGALSVSPSADRRIEFSVVKARPDNSTGAYIEMMQSIGQGYYDEPLHIRAPLFPAALALSYSLFTKDDRPFMVLSYGFKPPFPIFQSWKIWSAQLWAALPPLLFNLATVGLTACLAWVLFDSSVVALGAAILLASNPVSIWLAHKLLTEDMSTFFATASMTALAVLWKRNRAAAGGLAGVLAGLAVLTNQRVGLILPVTMGFAWMVLWQDTPDRSVTDSEGSRICGFIGRTARVVVQPFFWIYAAAFIAVTGFWFWKVISFYGNPLYQSRQKLLDAVQGDSTGWFMAVASRPHSTIIYSAGLIILCPLFVFALMTWKRSWAGWTGRVKDPLTRGLTLLWMWVGVFFIYMANLTGIFESGNKEHRYFYPVYPALAVLAAFGLNDLRIRLERHYPEHIHFIRSVVGALIILNAVWGCLQAYPKIFADEMLF